MGISRSLIHGAFEVVNKAFPARVAHAHCDIPCGIYDPHMAQLAALTVVRMNQLIQNLPVPAMDASPQDRNTYVAQLSRYTKVKEEHSELCKHELRIIWGDYFRPEHVEQYPDLHNLFFQAMKLASRNRQAIDMEAAQSLLSHVQDIAEIFWKTKNAAIRRQASLQTAGGELVYPVPQQ
ncbi:MAG: superoxide dismutase, Ni [Dehalococcoidia bacterium]|nr:superoxide dismutase, Ni [Dehalococcoidia bacterium]